MGQMIYIAPSWAMGATYVAGARSAGVVLDNAATNQRAGQVIADASTTVVCAEILAMGVGGSDKYPSKQLDPKELASLAAIKGNT